MAIFHMQIKTVTRAQGRNALASAAYRAGESIRDERTGTIYDHRKRRDVLYKEIMLPSSLERSGAGMNWARDRSALWHAAERAERQRNSRVAREYMLALPAELSGEQRVALAKAFSREIADRYNVAVDLSVHAPRPYGDPRNFHAHLLTTTRQVTPEGLGAKTGLDMQGTVRAELDLPPARQQFRELRERWAELANEALRAAHTTERIDHRSLAEQGIDREPLPSLPVGAVAALRRGERNEFAERLFERYRRRVAARQAAGTATVDRSSSIAGKRTFNPTSADPQVRRQQAVKDWLAYRAVRGQTRGPAGEPRGRPDAEELRRRAVKTWRGLRAREGESRGSEPAREPDAQTERVPEPSRDRGPDLSV